MIPEVFEWNGRGPMIALAEHAHVHVDGRCVKNREGVWCNAPQGVALSDEIARERVDHAATARDTVETMGFPDENGLLIAHAQVHATLALVEQQRIANLLHLAEFESAVDGGQRIITGFEYAAKLRLMVSEALGLEPEQGS